MLESLLLIIDQTNREFRGHTFNGYSLMETLTKISAITAANTDTYEGYSAWDNLVHCVYFKFYLVRFLKQEKPLLPFPWEEGSFPLIEDTSEDSWQNTLAYAELVHDRYILALQDLTEAELKLRIEPWDCTLEEAIIWIPTHDTYHVAQIRNMGLPEFQKKRKKSL